MTSYYRVFELLNNEPKSLIRYQSYRRIARSPRLLSVYYQSNFDRYLLAQSYISIVLAYIQGNNVAHGLKKGNTCKLPVLFSWAIQVVSGLLRIHLFRFSELQNLLTVKKLGLVRRLVVVYDLRFSFPCIQPVRLNTVTNVYVAAYTVK